MSKIALVTGANKGIGFETARQLLALGYTVLVGARDAEKGSAAAATLGAGAHFVQLDMSKSNSFPEIASRIESEFGKLDALINNAGVGLDWGVPPSEVTIDQLRETFETNVFGVIALTQSLLPLLKKSEAGRIVNLTSNIGSLTNQSTSRELKDYNAAVAYCSSKSALNMFTVLLAKELRETNIKVNSAHPGWVQTDMGGEQAPMKIEDGAKTSVFLATLPEDGPTGKFFHREKELPW
jgi:NAD(P)-dependent dehydrogenase (short-subunit alcohol dehydrogenase family)